MAIDDYEEGGNTVAGKRSNSQPVVSPLPEHGTPCAFAQVLKQDMDGKFEALELKVCADKELFSAHETEQNGQIKRIAEILLPGLDKKLDNLLMWIIGLLVTILASVMGMVVYIITHWPGPVLTAG